MKQSRTHKIIEVRDNKHISVIQEEFSRQYPYLKIEFLSALNKHRKTDPGQYRILRLQEKTIGECRTVKNSGDIVIDPHMTVTDLEQAFKKIYGLQVNLLRRSGNSWLSTSVTDEWSLEKQNHQGEAISRMIT